MILTYGCAVLRALEESDAALLKSMMNNPAVEAMTVGWNLPVSSQAQAEWQRAYRPTAADMRWVVELTNGAALGMVMLMGVDWKNRVAQLSYKRDPNVKDRMPGDMKDAVYAAVRYAFLELGLHRLEAGVLEYNAPSRRLVEWMGFAREGVQRGRIYKNGAWHDEILYGLLRDDFRDFPAGAAPWRAPR